MLTLQRKSLTSLTIMGLFLEFMSVVAPNTVTAQPTYRIAKMRTAQNQSSLKNTEYLKSIKKKLEHCWYPAKGQNAHATVTFRINKDGSVSFVELTGAAADPEINFSAMAAVTSSSPFSAPTNSNFIDIAADFNSDFNPLFRLGYTRPSDSDLESAAHLYTSALLNRKSGRLEETLQALQQAHRLVPYNATIRDQIIGLCLACSKTKQNEQAIKLLHQALLLDPTNQNIRGELNALLRATGKDPTSHDLRLTMARDYGRVFQYDDALCEYGEAWLLKQDQTLIPEINIACQHKANYADVQKWQAAVKVNDNASYRVQLAHAYEACGDSENAISEYHSALKSDPANQEASAGLDKLQFGKSNENHDSSDINGTVQLRDDFPYCQLDNYAVNVRVVKNRTLSLGYLKALNNTAGSIDYLKAACGTQLTRWPHQTTFRLYVDDAKNIQGYYPEYRQIMITAFATWMQALDNIFSFKVVNTPQQANIGCYWVPEHTLGMQGNELGETQSSYIPNNNEAILLSTRVLLLTMFPGKRKLIPPSEIRAVCLHEIGHALGIMGHSPNKGDVMYPSVSTASLPSTLTARDVATIRRLYRDYAHK